MDSHRMHVMTLANSIIGVSILAMPFCFKKCGIVLSILLLLISSIISRLACHFLLKSAIKARLRTFEFLAYHAFGSFGKLIVEIGLIGFLVGTCIAFFVVMGDLAPEIVAEMASGHVTNTLRTSVLLALALFCILPLGLLRNVDSLSGVSTAGIAFYACLVLKIISESVPHIIKGDWSDKVSFWRPAGVLQCLPIFSMALCCQTSLFEIYQAIPNASLEKMNNLIRWAVNICTCVYIFVGVFGYIAVSNQQFTGNILLSFQPSIITSTMKIGFVFSVAISFPLIIFPCRASLYSLLYKSSYTLHDGSTNYIPEAKFKTLTFVIVFTSLVIGVMIPNIELVLGLVGSTIGVMICIIFPATCFICLSSKNTNERILAQIMLFVGIVMMVLGTYANLYAFEEATSNPITDTPESYVNKINIPVNDLHNKAVVIEVPEVKLMEPENVKINKLPENRLDVIKNQLVISSDGIKEIRHEPPQPEAPEETEPQANKEKLPIPVEDPRNKIRNLPMQGDNQSNKIKIPNEIKNIKEMPITGLEAAKVVSSAENNMINKKISNDILDNIEAHIKPQLNVNSNELVIDNSINKNNNDNEQNKISETAVEHHSGKNFESNVLKEGDILIQNNKEDRVIKGSTSNLEKNQKLQIEEKKEEVAKEAIDKEEQEIKQQQEKEILKDNDKNNVLIENLKKENEVNQKKLTEEKLKAVKEIESIAKKAIESLVENDNKENAEKVVKQAIANLEQSKSKLELQNPSLNSVLQTSRNTTDNVNISTNIKVNNSRDVYDLKNFVPIPIVKSNNASFYNLKSVNNKNSNSVAHTNSIQFSSNTHIPEDNKDKIKNLISNYSKVKEALAPGKAQNIGILNVLKGGSNSNINKENVPHDTINSSTNFTKTNTTIQEHKQGIEEQVKEDLKAIRRDILSDEILIRQKREVDTSIQDGFYKIKEEQCEKSKSASIRK